MTNKITTSKTISSLQSLQSNPVSPAAPRKGSSEMQGHVSQRCSRRHLVLDVYLLGEIAKWDAGVHYKLCLASKEYALSAVARSVARHELTRKIFARCRIEWRRGREQLHRLDGTAVEWVDGSKTWHVEGKLHRLDGPAIEWVNGDRMWYVNSKLHRTDGPAVDFGNRKEWWVDGKIRRSDCGS